MSASGAPRLRKGHELLRVGEDELDPGQRNGIPLSNALPCRASCANAWRKPNGGLRVPASPCCARDGLVVLPPRRSTRVLRPVPSRRWSPTVRFVRCVPSTKEGKLRNACHYLGSTPGVQHFVRSAEGEPLAVPGAAEDRTASSWERRQPAFRRQQRKVTALGQNQTSPMFSHRRRSLDDRRYALRPALLETFCESLAGTCCRATNPGRQNTGPRQARHEKRICASGQGCKASSTKRRFRRPSPG